jgi:hypothetical protein
MSGTLHLAQALSNRGRRGRKNDFRDAERLVKRVGQLRLRRFGAGVLQDGEQQSVAQIRFSTAGEANQPMTFG